VIPDGSTFFEGFFTSSLDGQLLLAAGFGGGDGGRWLMCDEDLCLGSV